MKKILLSLIIVLSTQLFAQKGNFKVYGTSIDTIAYLIKKHPKYIPHLKEKILLNKEMSDKELFMLYYGSCFDKDYHPKKEDNEVTKIATQLGEMDFSGAIQEGEKLLKKYPINARLYMLLGYAYKKIGEKQKSKYYYKRYADIIQVPLISGDGKDFNHARIVRITSDEYLILNQNDLELVQQELRYNNKIPHDVMLVKPISKKNTRIKNLPKEKVYFNVYLPFFIGQGKSFNSELEKAKRKYKVKTKN